MSPITRTFSFLTAGFPHGAYQSQGFNQPDLRGPSVKGQLRWWFDALHGTGEARCNGSEDKIFGGLKIPHPGSKPGPEASRIAIRIIPLSGEITPLETHILPHKPDPADRGPKKAIPPGTRFIVSLLPRREALSDREQQQLERVLDAWLLLGAVGQRANRAAGSLWPEGAPASAEEYIERAAELLKGSKLRCAVLPGAFGTDEQKVRQAAGDILDGPVVSVQRGSWSAKVVEPWWPFGAANDRKPSPLKLRAALLGQELRLVAIWDARYQPDKDLRRGVERLAQHKELGRMLSQVLGQLCVTPASTQATR